MPENISLKTLEANLSKNPELRTAFLKDPIKTLKGGGIDLSADQAASVKAQFTEMGLAKIPELSALRIRIKIKIGIGISTS